MEQVVLSDYAIQALGVAALGATKRWLQAHEGDEEFQRWRAEEIKKLREDPIGEYKRLRAAPSWEQQRRKQA